MKRIIDERVGRKFGLAAAVLMTRVFSTPLPANRRRLSFAAGPASGGTAFAPPDPNFKFDVVGLGFVPGREWAGPTEIFVEELRDDEVRVWRNCRFWTDSNESPMYIITDDPEVCFSFDGNSLIVLSGSPDGLEKGVRRARKRLRDCARRLPGDIEQHRMM